MIVDKKSIGCGSSIALRQSISKKVVETQTMVNDEEEVMTQTNTAMGIATTETPVAIRDWEKSRLYAVVLKIGQKRLLEHELFNPEHIDIFTEEEACYNASFLRKKGQFGDTQYDEIILDELYQKSKRTVQVLSDIMMLSEGHEDLLEFRASVASPMSVLSSKILQKESYLRVDKETVLTLLFRCKRLY